MVSLHSLFWDCNKVQQWYRVPQALEELLDKLTILSDPLRVNGIIKQYYKRNLAAFYVVLGSIL